MNIHSLKHRATSLLSHAIGACALGLVSPWVVMADPPQALPARASFIEIGFEPAYDYLLEGCYATPAIGPDGTIATGLRIGGDVNGHCRDASDLQNTNVYSRAKCNNGWCGIMYASYFEKDQTQNGIAGIGSHTHEWEHVIVWVELQTTQVKFVAVSSHEDWTDPFGRDKIQFENLHPKVTYFKEGGIGGAGSHRFGLSVPNHQPQNHFKKFQYPPVIGWLGGFPEGLREKLLGAFSGGIHPRLRDGDFESSLNRTKPKGIPFDPFGPG